ncbi:ribonuclease HII [Demequina gelatinilytica]|uniref:ribonuclease HII n=1 Tax=Demequina gelatinilytica TaxID=1638980 RepID=UPI00078315C3|nr:ribonuclease HII [Demequina gelatinilytica]
MSVSLTHEAELWDAGLPVVAGIDEVGRGALAGPVSVGVVAVTRCDSWPEGLTDSKLLSAARREALIAPLAEFGVARAVGHASSVEIDAIGIVAALRLAARRALDAMDLEIDAVLLDGTHDWLTPPPADLFSDDAEEWAAPPVTMVVKGDRACASIAAASVLAKVERDALMAAAHAEHPVYAWDSNKGYGAASHLDALREHGPSPLHRVSWKLPFRA